MTFAQVDVVADEFGASVTMLVGADDVAIVGTDVGCRLGCAAGLDVPIIQ